MIREISEADVERLDATHPEPERPSSRHAERWDRHRAGEGVYLIAWDLGRPVGWVFVRPPASPEASAHARRAGCAELVDLYVEPASRGRGHGASLLAAAERAAVDLGSAEVGLAVTVSNPHNDVARAMYERRGYRDAGFGDYDDGYTYWTTSGEERWDGEPHRFLRKVLDT